MKIKLLPFIIVFFPLVSCEDILQTEDNKYEVLDTREDIQGLLTGSYYWLLQLHDNCYLEYVIRGDDIGYHANNVSSYQGEDSRIIRCGWSGTQMHKSFDGLYKKFYLTILNTNRIIESFQEIDFSDDLDPLLGEAYLIRAYSYFKLTRFFGKIPLIDNTKVDYDVKLSEYSAIYDFIEEDMLKAIELLPVSYDEARLPGITPHQGTVKAMLAEVYLTMGGYPLLDEAKYTLAAELAGEVIDNAEMYHFTLLDDFADLWTKDHRVNEEIVFALFCTDKATTENELLLTNRIDPMYDIDRHPNNIDYRVRSGILPELNYFNNMPLNYRKRVTFHMGYYRFWNEEFDDITYSWSEWVETDSVWNHCEMDDFVYCQKWIDIRNINDILENTPDIEGYYSFRDLYLNSQTIYIYRYAHTLLTYAESKARSGQLDESAYEALNKVIRRAYKQDINVPSPYDLSPGLTPEQFAESVVWERAWEFYYEPEGRWFDIVRLDLLDEMETWQDPREINVFVSEVFPNKGYFARIPQEDIWLNPDLDQYNDNE